ncbi:MAG: DUF5110 domain-containing protein [Bacteroidetes bacterium]|nr:DUF5110 domain-containing protein [Bacteroidota bacterium]
MKKFVFISLLVFFSASLFAQSWEKSENGATINLNGKKLQVQWVSDQIVRILVSPTGKFSKSQSLVVTHQPEKTTPSREEKNDSLYLSIGKNGLAVSLKTGGLRFWNAIHQNLLRSESVSKNSFSPYTEFNESVWSVRQNFTLDATEGIFGLGQYQDGVMNYRGEEVLIAQANTMAAVPFMISSKGWGLFWHNYSKSVFHDGNDGTFLSAEVADQIDYYVVLGSRPDEAIAGYRKLTGKAPMYGKWAYGFWQSKERYAAQDEVLAVAAEFRKRQIPIDNIVQDWSYWGPMEQFSGMVWDTKTYPDPAAMASRLKKEFNLHLMVSIWPAFGKESAIYKDMEKSGFLFSEGHWSPSKVYDAWNPDARQLYWKYAKKAVFDMGADGWWMDGSEPEFKSTDDRFITEIALKKNGKNHLGSIARYLNTFSLQTTKGIYENQRKVTDEKRVFILTRSSFAGQQRYSAALWSGDITSSWQVMRNQISGGLNVSMAGNPYWTSDIGGFISAHRFPDGVKDPAYRELYVRWFQWGAFSPIFRSHGTNTPREIWQFGEPGSADYDAIEKADKLRYRLMPYIYSQAWKVWKSDATLMRGLVMDFPEDPKVFKLDTEFMFGPSMLVSAITKSMVSAPVRIQEYIPPRNLFGPDGKSHGLIQDFFIGYGFDTLAVSRRSEAFNLTWMGSLPTEVADKPYCIRYTGKVKAEEPGTYQFICTVTGGARLWINGMLLLDKWNNDGQVVETVFDTFEAGESFDVKLEYRQPKPNSAGLVLEWISPDRKSKTIASDNIWTTYLPNGSDWYDFWTGDKLAGGTDDIRSVSLSEIPIYVKAGSILPIGPAIQYTGEKPADPIELRVYPGSDGQFDLYEDEGDSYRYEKGISAVIPMEWNQKDGILTLGDRKGSFPGMLATRTFKVVVVKPGHGTGELDSQKPDQIVTYSGKKMVIVLK